MSLYSSSNISVLPNFLIIGAQKAGTRWIKLMLDQHPDIFIAKKETHYFNDHYEKGLDYYKSFFIDSNEQKAIGEKTPGYLWVPSQRQKEFPKNKVRNVPKMVHNYDPGIKLIVSLRDPVKRAVSAYYHHMRARRIAPGDSILETNPLLGIVDRGFYHHQLTNWFDFFPREQFLILIFERDVVQNSAGTIQQAFHFLKVDESFEPEPLKSRYNRRWGPSVLYLNYYAPSLGRLASLLPVFNRIPFPSVEVSENDVAELSELYKESNARLSELIEFDPDLWT